MSTIKEEPEFVNEADIPSEDQPPDRDGKDKAPKPRGGASPNPDVRTPKNADVAGAESVAGEEDPGAALDTPGRTP
jgi:hypothetical protein